MVAMAAKIKPKHVEIRTYQVGFGDCFLLTFKYPRFDRNVLVDFGSMRLPDGSKRNYRATSMPCSMSRRSTSGEREAGPMVQTILVLGMGSAMLCGPNATLSA